MLSSISIAIGYLAKTLKDNKTFDEFLNEFTNASINWLKPIFLKDKEPKEELKDLVNAPSDELNIQTVELVLAKAIRDNPALKEKLNELVNEIENKKSSKQTNQETQKISGEKILVY